MTTEYSSNIILIDKPKGITSFDVIRRLRRELGIKKMGHAGTLDPLASGLMIIGINEGTKHLTNLLKLPKEYVADVRIGERRSTGDLEGEVLESVEVGGLKKEVVEAALATMIGTLTLPVSAYSAIKREGTPLYKTARRKAARGETIPDSELPLRDMTVTEAELLSLERVDKFYIATVRFAVSSGTYIRSLGEELGRRLGYPATLSDLRRTKIGEFDIAESRTLT